MLKYASVVVCEKAINIIQRREDSATMPCADCLLCLLIVDDGLCLFQRDL